MQPKHRAPATPSEAHDETSGICGCMPLCMHCLRSPLPPSVRIGPRRCVAGVQRPCPHPDPAGGNLMDTPASHACGIHAARLNLADYATRFGDAHPPLTRPQALIEAERCYYCHDAPCATACPTGIDIPSFIHRIAQDNNRGAARAILEANPWVACAPASAPPRCCASRPACATPMRTSRSRSARCSATPPMPSSPSPVPRCSSVPHPPASASPWSGPAPQAWPAPTAWRCAATTSCCSTPAPSSAASTNTGWPATRPPATSPRRKSSGCCRLAASRCARTSCWAAT